MQCSGGNTFDCREIYGMYPTVGSCVSTVKATSIYIVVQAVNTLAWPAVTTVARTPSGSIVPFILV